MQSGSSSLPGAKVRDAPAVKMRSLGPTNPPIRTGAHDARRFLAPPHHEWGGGAICPLNPLTLSHLLPIFQRHPIPSLANQQKDTQLFCQYLSNSVFLIIASLCYTYDLPLTWFPHQMLFRVPYHSKCFENRGKT